MPKRKYIDEDDLLDQYLEAECPQCGAPLTLRFQRGRARRRVTCPVCLARVEVTRGPDKTPEGLVQIAPPSTD